MQMRAESVTRPCESSIAAGSVPQAFMRMSGVKGERLMIWGALKEPFSRVLPKTCLHPSRFQGAWRCGRGHVERDPGIRSDFTKSVLALLVCAACLGASTNPGARVPLLMRKSIIMWRN
jgi:hypothetical protein